MAVIHDARGQVLDELTQMLLRLTRKVEWKSELRLMEWYQTRRNKTDALIRAFRDSLIVHGSDVDPVQKVSRVETVFAAQGGHEALVKSCEEHLHQRDAKQEDLLLVKRVNKELRAQLAKALNDLNMYASVNVSLRAEVNLYKSIAEGKVVPIGRLKPATSVN